MILIKALLFAVPIYIANASGTLSASIPIIKKWKQPIDFGVEINGKRLLGDGKTFRGLILGTLTGTTIGYILFSNVNSDISIVSSLNDQELLLLSFLLSFGALIGDITKSLAKRRLNIKRGKPWVPFDQIDFIIGGILFGSIAYFPGWMISITLILLTPLLHFLSNVIAYKLGLKNVWW